MTELADTDRKIEAARDVLTITQRHVTEQEEILARFTKEKFDAENALSALKMEVESLRQQSTSLKAETEETQKLLDRAREQHSTEDKKVNGLRAEIQLLVTAIASKQNEATTSEKRLESISSKLLIAEKRAAELADIETRIKAAQASLKAVEKQRDQEEKTLADGAKERERLRRELADLAEQQKTEAARAADFVKRTKAEETRFADAQKKADKAAALLDSIEARRTEAEQSVQAARDEEKAVRAGMPAINAEMAAAQTALQALLAQRSSEEARAKNLEAEAAAATRRLVEADQHATVLEQKAGATKQELAAMEAKLAELTARSSQAQAASDAATQRLGSLQAQLQEREAILGKRVAELGSRLDALRREEDNLTGSLSTTREQLTRDAATLEEVQKKLAASESRLGEFLQSGGKLISVTEALGQAETRRKEVERALSEAAEQELALQVKLNGLLDNVKKESLRLDNLRRECENTEEDHKRTIEKANRDFDEVRHRLVEDMKREEAAAMARLKERIADMQQKHDFLSRGLAASMDEQTVILFANDLIKRLDLIDILVQRYSGPGVNGGVEQQLRTLRSSVEDILAQHGIQEFRVDSGTEVDVKLRQRIAIVENVTGPAKPRVVESFRPGFVYARDDGRELILRKVEVKTSSE